MKEPELINKIEELKQIQPRKDWVVSAKRELFEENPREETSPFSVLFNPIQKPVLALGTIALAAFVMSSLFFTSAQNLPGAESLITFNTNNTKEEVTSESLMTLQKQVEELNLKLEELRKSEDPNEALVMSENIKTTAKKGQEVLSQIELKESESKTLASLSASLRELGNEATKEQKEMIEALIEDLKTRSLTVENQERLQKAESSYNNGNMEQALFYLLRITK